jgi:4-amino-4-deoxy-L-arabinose transferase-like glycosyltransferase
MAALSPYFLANSVGRMSHALAGLLVTAASVLCIQGLKSGKLSRFVWMFVLVAATFHVRPLTAFVTSVVLGLAALIGTRARRVLCMRVAALGGAGAILAVSSFLLYDWRFTGNPLLVPYAQYRGIDFPAEVGTSGTVLLNNLWTTWRFGLQSTVLYSFPFLALLVLYAFWASRPKSPAPWILLALPCALVLAYLVNSEYSASIVGQRYWFEGYFAIVVLAAEGLTRLLAAWRCGRRTVIPVAIGLAVTQLVMMATAAVKLDRMSFPGRTVKRVAERYRNCDCVVFLADTLPDFHAIHLNPNTPNWPSARVFYAVDPGPGERAKWAGILRKGHWVVLRYDAERKIAEVAATGPA